MVEDLDSIVAKALDTDFQQLSDVEILALILNSGQNPVSMAQYLVDRFQNLQNLTQLPFETLVQIPGLGRSRAIRLKAALSLGQHLRIIPIVEKPVIERPSDAIALLRPRLENRLQEQVLVVLLDTHNRVMDIETVYIGSLSMTSVRVGEVFRRPITRNCAGIILAHNHPSGDATPSQEDVSFTCDLVEAGRVLDIAVLDHLIIGDGEWVSMRERKQGFSTER